jgi:hypothetical protein
MRSSSPPSRFQDIPFEDDDEVAWGRPTLLPCDLFANARRAAGQDVLDAVDAEARDGGTDPDITAVRAPEPSPAQVERTLKLTAGARRARAGSDATDARASSSAPNTGGGVVNDWAAGAALQRPLFAVAAAPGSAAEDEEPPPSDEPGGWEGEAIVEARAAVARAGDHDGRRVGCVGLPVVPDPPWWSRLFAWIFGSDGGAAEADPRGGYGGAIARRVNPVFEDPAPWTGAELPDSADLGAVRTQLTDRLYALRDAAPSRADWRFVDRIMRATAAPRLDFPLFPDAAIKLDALLRSGDPPRAEVSARARWRSTAPSSASATPASGASRWARA